MAGGRPAVRVEGVTATQQGLRRMAGRIADTERPAERGADRIAETARALAPRRSGALSESIDVQVSDGVATVTAGGRDVPYAGVQEYGWPARHVPAQPYLGPAADEHRDDVVDEYRDHVADNVRRFGREVP